MERTETCAEHIFKTFKIIEFYGVFQNVYWEGASFGNVLFIVFLFVLQFVSFVFLIF